MNPQEYALADVASGAHIRFRLGGHKFPPTVYYKVYTHASISDINSFAPRYFVNGGVLTKFEFIRAMKLMHKNRSP
jgi:hypothetical protein